MKKKAISLLMAAAMSATMLAGCGSDGGDKQNAAAGADAAGADEAGADAAGSDAVDAAGADAVSTEEAPADNDAAVSDMKIAMITDSGDITDESFNQITWETCIAFGEDKGVEYEYYKPAEDTDEERINAIDLAVQEGATVIVMPGYLFGPAIAEEQALYPDVSFIVVDITEEDVKIGENVVGINDNVYICSFQEEQAGYLAGYAAVKDGYTKLGFLGGIAVPAVIRYGYGYVQGINDAAEELGVDVSVKHYYGGKFNGDDAITARMEGWYADGTEIVFACGGGIYTSAVDAAKEYDGKVIGVDVDQRSKIGDMCVTSAMKGLHSAVYAALDAYASGNWASIGGKSEQLGLAQGDYLGLPTEEESWGFSTFTVDEYNAVLAGIKDGSVTVSNDIENQPTVGAHVTVDYVE